MGEEANVDVERPGASEPANVDTQAPGELLVTCALCSHTVGRESAYFVNSQLACAGCVAQVRAELASQAPGGIGVLVAGVAGLAGALVGAAVWSGVAIATDLEVGYVAVLVGFLAGLGVKLGAGKQRGRLLQYLAAALAVVGLLAAKYMLFAYALVKVGRERGLSIGYLDGRILSFFPEALGQMLGAFDVLFLFLALGAAYRVPKAHAVSITKA